MVLFISIEIYEMFMLCMAMHILKQMLFLFQKPTFLVRLEKYKHIVNIETVILHDLEAIFGSHIPELSHRYALHLWRYKWREVYKKYPQLRNITEESIKSMNNTFGRIARYMLYGSAPSITGLWYLWPILLTRLNFNPNVDYKVLFEITYSFPNFDSETVEVWDWISN